MWAWARGHETLRLVAGGSQLVATAAGEAALVAAAYQSLPQVSGLMSPVSRQPLRPRTISKNRISRLKPAGEWGTGFFKIFSTPP